MLWSMLCIQKTKFDSFAFIHSFSTSLSPQDSVIGSSSPANLIYAYEKSCWTIKFIILFVSVVLSFFTATLASHGYWLCFYMKNYVLILFWSIRKKNIWQKIRFGTYKTFLTLEKKQVECSLQIKYSQE